MYSDPIEAGYFEQRLQTTLDMAAHAVDPGVMRAHLGLASCYRGKLTSLLRVGSTPTRTVLSLNAFRDRRPATGVLATGS
jgi:hypothetical protein